MPSVWGCKRNATVHDLVRHATSLTKLKICVQCTSPSRHNKRRKSDAETEDAEAATKIISSQILCSPSNLPARARHRQGHHLQPQTFGPTHPKNAKDIAIISITSTRSIDDAPYCRFSLAVSHLSMQCLGLLPLILTKLIRKPEENLLSIWRRPRWPH